MFGWSPFHSLRARLIASYAFVIFLSLFLAGSAFIYLLRTYQTEARLNQFAGLVTPIAGQVWTLERQGSTPAQMSDLLREQATEMKVRILLLDSSQRVVVDTAEDSSLTNQEVSLPPKQDEHFRGSVRSGLYTTSAGQRIRVLWLPPPSRPRSPALDRLIPRSPQLSVALAVQPDDLATAWLELAPHLAGAALTSLVISTAVALFISRSITRPISQVTVAAEAMARGNYDHRIPAAGADEVGRLAATFNAMARDVGNSHRMLRDFLANVSHDLRTPLTSIQGFSQAMLEGTIQTSEEYKQAAQIINDDSARMRHLVEDLLYLSKIESGQVNMERRKLDLADLLRSCTRRFAWQAEQSNIRLNVDITSAAEVEGDGHYLEQVFANLLDNALRHTPVDGEVTVRAWMDQPPTVDGWAPELPRLDAPRVVYVAVQNSGSHIAPQDLSRIFERFFQVDRSRSKTASGSGLGLAIVREIVQSHRGAVAARSQAEKGTEFLVMLPAPGPSPQQRRSYISWQT
ncbi:MAG: sensor histidine kinase [Chloroflexota bacterium]|nr:MAG: sensor histidine kinase [Chloroflexota bacterium]